MTNKSKLIDSDLFTKKFLGKKVTAGDMVRAARLHNGFTQDELAYLSDIKKSFISAIENNRRKIGTTSALRLAAALGLHPATILFPDGFSDSADLKEIKKKRSTLLKSKAS